MNNDTPQRREPPGPQWSPFSGQYIELRTMPKGYPAPDPGQWRAFRARYRDRAKAIAERTGKMVEVYDNAGYLIDEVKP